MPATRPVQVLRRDAITGGVDVLQAGTHLLIHEQRTARPSPRTASGGHVRRRPHADRQHHDIHRQCLAVNESKQPMFVAGHPVEPRPKPQVDSVPANLVGDQGGDRLVKGRHHRRHGLDHRDRHAASMQGLSHFQTHVAGADHKCPGDPAGVEQDA